MKILINNSRKVSKYISLSVLIIIGTLTLLLIPKANQEKLTKEQLNAIKYAEDYIDKSNLSEKKLRYIMINKAGYTATDSQFAIDYVKKHQYVNWNEKAYQSALHYIDLGTYDKKSLYERLIADNGEQFTETQASYAVNRCKELN